MNHIGNRYWAINPIIIPQRQKVPPGGRFFWITNLGSKIISNLHNYIIFNPGA